MSITRDPIRLMHCDLNWAIDPVARMSRADDWAFIDPQAYFDWHVEFGTNVIYCQAFVHGGYAFYPTKLGPWAPGPGSDLFGSLYRLARDKDMPVWSYMCAGMDLVMCANWHEYLTFSQYTDHFQHGFLAPETPWTDLLCARIREFLGMYPVDWLLLDWFVYGDLKPNEHRIHPYPFMQQPFKEVTGRALPSTTEEITDEENLVYKREMLARQFHRIQEATKQTSPETKLIFNIPFWEPAEPLWVDHPMVNESDGLFAESTNEAVLNWLLEIKRPEQHVMTTLSGRADDHCDPDSWRQWYDKGCDFFGYAWGTPPDFRPHPKYENDLKIVRAAFDEMEANRRAQ